jgi:hypothetical protein
MVRRRADLGPAGRLVLPRWWCVLRTAGGPPGADPATPTVHGSSSCGRGSGGPMWACGDIAPGQSLPAAVALGPHCQASDSAPGCDRRGLLRRRRDWQASGRHLRVVVVVVHHRLATAGGSGALLGGWRRGGCAGPSCVFSRPSWSTWSNCSRGRS